MGKIIYGSEVSSELREELRLEAEHLKQEGKRIPKLAVILAGDNPASLSYVKGKAKACEAAGILEETFHLDGSVSQKELEDLDLLILDDIGLQCYDLDSCRIFYEILDARYKVGSTLLISQFPVSTWMDLFSDKTYGNGVLSRNIENSVRLEIQSEDIRKRTSNLSLEDIEEK